MKMKALPELFHRLDRRTLLLAAAALLLLLNLGRFGWLAFSHWQTTIDDRANQLLKYRKAVARIETLRQEVAQMERQEAALRGYLFTANSEEDAASAMQVMLQDEVVKAGLEPEFLQPSLNAATPTTSDRKQGKNTIVIKLRLGGTLNNFAQFIQSLYRSKKLFTIESFTLKSYKKDEVKIFLEVKGHYALTSGAPPVR